MTAHSNHTYKSKKANYGIDAPGVVRNIFLIAFISFFLSVIFHTNKITFVHINPMSFVTAGISAVVCASLMLNYSLYGKYKYRERLLNQVKWKGDEQVLDVGTGKGLLMVGAAKKLTTGKSFGIDIWNKQDLTGNNLSNALHNAFLEGVTQKVQVENENAAQMNFADNYFDVVLSNLCLHNIDGKHRRKQACGEIYRVLKPGGTVIISDLKHTAEYRKAFQELGMRIEKVSTSYLTTFPPLTSIKAVKYH
jgi:arsenite methyltransferase